MEKTILIYSGGADSTTLLYWLISEGHYVKCLSFDYGQRHSKEIMAARNICELENLAHHTVSIEPFSCLVKSALTGQASVPHGHYHEKQMRQTVVPNRNMVMISIAASMAISHGFDNIAIGAHAGDHVIYPDCRREFMTFAESAIWAGNWGKKPRLIAPFLKKDKKEIIRIGKKLGVPYEMTWTCYEGGDHPCQKCAACVERNEAMDAAA